MSNFVSLIDLVEKMKPYLQSGYTDDLTVVKMYLSQEGITKDVPKLLTDLLSEKIEKGEHYVRYTRSNMMMPVSYYYSEFDEDTAYKLDQLTRYMQLGLPFSDESIEWMKKFDLSKVKGMFWHDLYEVIEYYQGKIDKPDFVSLNPFVKKEDYENKVAQISGN